MFVHHVFFWLKHPDSAADKAKLIDGLQQLSHVEGIKMYHIGQPAETDRGVIDGSYSISWLTLFESKEAEKAYQVDPLHLRFVDACSSVWSKVIVYDSEDV